MVTWPHGGASKVWRSREDDGVSSSAVHEPLKEEIRALISAMQSVINGIIAGTADPGAIDDLVQRLADIEEMVAGFEDLQDAVDVIKSSLLVNLGTLTGTNSALVAAAVGVTSPYQNGKIYQAIAPGGGANSGNATININGAGATPLRDWKGDELQPGSIANGAKLVLAGYGTHVRVMAGIGVPVLKRDVDRIPIDLGTATRTVEGDFDIYTVVSDEVTANPLQNGKRYTVTLPSSNTKSSPKLRFRRSNGDLVDQGEIRQGPGSWALKINALPAGKHDIAGNGANVLTMNPLVRGGADIGVETLATLIENKLDAATFTEFSANQEAAFERVEEVAADMDGAVAAAKGSIRPQRPGEQAWGALTKLGTMDVVLANPVPRGWAVDDPDMGASIELKGENVASGQTSLVLRRPDPIEVESGRIYDFSAWFRRTVNSVNLGGDVVRVQALYLGAVGKALLGTASIFDATLTVAQGVRKVTRRFAFASGGGVDFVMPAGTVYVALIVEQFGNTPTMRVARLDFRDVTDIAPGGADYTNLAGRVTTVEADQAGKASRDGTNRTDDFDRAQDVMSFRKKGATGLGTGNDGPAMVLALAEGRSISGRPGDIYRATTSLLGSSALTRLDLRGAVVLVDFPNGSDSNSLDVSHVKNGEFQIASGRVIKRFHIVAGDLQDVTYSSVDQHPETNANQDGILRANANGIWWVRVKTRKIDCPIRVSYLVHIRDIEVEDFVKGIRFNNCPVDLIGFRFGAISPNGTSDTNINPGQNALASGSDGGPTGGRVWNGVISDSAEHALYFNNFTRGYDLHLWLILILASGRSGVKLRRYSRGSIRDVESYDCASPTAGGHAVGDNEDNFHLELITDYLLVNLVGGRKLRSYCGWSGLYLFGPQRVRGRGAFFDTPAHAGIELTQKYSAELGVTAPQIQDILLEDYTVVGGRGLLIESVTEAVGQVEIRKLTVQDCPSGVDPITLLLTLGVQSGKAIIVTGTFSGAGALTWTVPVITGVDLSGFLPANRSATVAAAATTSVGLLSADTIAITTGVAITSLGSGAVGWKRTLIAANTFTLTNNSAITGLPATQTIRPGERVEVTCTGANTWAVRAILGINNAPRQPLLTKSQLLALSAATFAYDTMLLSDGDSNQKMAISDATNWRYPSGTQVT